ncbi:post-transcriptional regulator [Ammoniphilus sp. 3BR4]|uniref:post-transcriptional regulator n=1 Tax=Ammoniphilus sp. 3BR4 TaxID=3158265 RepID=UPI003464F8F8
MEDLLSLEDLKNQMKQVCKSKAEEFHLLGYENVTSEEIWECVASAYKKEIPPVHRAVNDILSLKVTKFMNWMTMKVYRGEFE